MTVTRTYSARGLAWRMNKSETYVHAMKRAGYVFTHGPETTYESAMEWRAEHPEFRITKWYLRKPKGSTVPKTSGAHVADTGGRSDERLLTHG